MRKSTLAVVLISVTLLLAALLWGAERNQGRLNSFIVEEKEAENLMSGRSLVSESVPDIYFDEQKAEFDASSNRFFYSLLEGQKSAYNPRVKAVLNGERACVYFVGDKISDEAIASNASIPMIVCTKDNFYPCELICTKLPIVSITADDEIGDEDSDMAVTVFDNSREAVRRVTESWGYIRIRGVMSRAFPKKSYKLTLKTESLGRNSRNDDVSLLGMRKDEDWILNSLYGDYEKVRNTFNHNLWTKSCGTDNAYNIETGICYKYVEVFLNGRYWGLYALGYRPDEKTLSSQNMAENEGLYKKLIYKVSGYRSDDYPLDSVFEYFTDVEESEGDADALKELVDIDNCIDFNLFTTLTQGIDNLEHNYYLLLKEFDGQKKGVFVPWDLDLCWGNERTLTDKNNVSYYSISADRNLLFTDDPVYELLAENDKDTYEKMFSKYHELRADAWSEDKINEMIDEYEEEIFASGAYYRDMERWPDGCYVDGISSLTTFRAYVCKRLSFMDSYMERLENGLTDNQFINQCLKYDNLNDSIFVIEIRDKSLLEDVEYSEFLSWLGVDPSGISEDCGYIICEFGDKRVEYIDSSFAPEESYETALGSLSLIYDETENYDYDVDFSVKLNGVKCFVSSPIDEKLIRVACLCDGTGDELYMKSAYKVESDLWDIPNSNIMLSFLDNQNGKVLLRVNDTKNDQVNSEKFLNQFALDLAGYSSITEALESSESLLFLLDGKDGTGYLIRDPYENGTYVETEIGTYAYYEGDSGYGIYINGEECQTGSFEEESENALDIMFFNDDWTEMTYHYIS